MNWFLLYAITCFLAQACFFVGMIKQEDKDKVDDALLGVLGASVWPLVLTVILPVMLLHDRWKERRKRLAIAATRYMINSDGTVDVQKIRKLSTKALQNLIDNRSEIQSASRNIDNIVDSALKEIAERELLA